MFFASDSVGFGDLWQNSIQYETSTKYLFCTAMTCSLLFLACPPMTNIFYGQYCQNLQYPRWPCEILYPLWSATDINNQIHAKL